MKVRIRFRKYGALRFIGHLDVMRFFQKVMRRAQIPIAFTSGYSPHMIMSFASPLGIGLTSDGEYFDIELKESISSEEAVRRMNAVTAEGIEVVSFRKIAEEKKMTGMAIVAAADYLVGMSTEEEPKCFRKYEADITAFLEQPQISVLKQTKRTEQEVDIRPLIYQMDLRENGIYLKLAAGSTKNLKPELVMSAFCRFAGIDEQKIFYTWHRLEMYALSYEVHPPLTGKKYRMPDGHADLSSDNQKECGERKLVSLESLGKTIESREIHD